MHHIIYYACYTETHYFSWTDAVAALLLLCQSVQHDIFGFLPVRRYSKSSQYVCGHFIYLQSKKISRFGN